MRTITTHTNVYTFDELSDKAKEKAIESLRDINVDYNWWDSRYDDAAMIGLRITGFDLERNRHATGEFNCLGGAIQCAGNIINEHGPLCDTYKLAAQYLKDQETIDKKYPNHEDTDSDDYSEHLESSGLLADEFLHDLLEEYSIMLQDEYEYLMSDDAIIDTINANDYTFTEDGTLYND